MFSTMHRDGHMVFGMSYLGLDSLLVIAIVVLAVVVALLSHRRSTRR